MRAIDDIVIHNESLKTIKNVLEKIKTLSIKKQVSVIFKNLEGEDGINILPINLNKIKENEGNSRPDPKKLHNYHLYEKAGSMVSGLASGAKNFVKWPFKGAKKLYKKYENWRNNDAENINVTLIIKKIGLSFKEFIEKLKEKIPKSSETLFALEIYETLFSCKDNLVFAKKEIEKHSQKYLNPKNLIIKMKSFISKKDKINLEPKLVFGEYSQEFSTIAEVMKEIEKLEQDSFKGKIEIKFYNKILTLSESKNIKDLFCNQVDFESSYIKLTIQNITQTIANEILSMKLDIFQQNKNNLIDLTESNNQKRIIEKYDVVFQEISDVKYFEKLMNCLETQIDKSILRIEGLTKDEALIAIENSVRTETHILIGSKTPISQIFSTIKPPHDEISEAKDEGLDEIIEFYEQDPLKWRSITVVALLGAVQIAVGAVLLLTIAPNIGSALITEGVNDIVFAITSLVTRKFSWKDYLFQKALSITISLITAGFSKLKAKNKVKIADMQSVEKEAIEELEEAAAAKLSKATEQKVSKATIKTIQASPKEIFTYNTPNFKQMSNAIVKGATDCLFYEEKKLDFESLKKDIEFNFHWMHSEEKIKQLIALDDCFQNNFRFQEIEKLINDELRFEKNIQAISNIKKDTSYINKILNAIRIRILENLEKLCQFDLEELIFLKSDLDKTKKKEILQIIKEEYSNFNEEKLIERVKQKIDDKDQHETVFKQIFKYHTEFLSLNVDVHIFRNKIALYVSNSIISILDNGNSLSLYPRVAQNFFKGINEIATKLSITDSIERYLTDYNVDKITIDEVEIACSFLAKKFPH